MKTKSNDTAVRALEVLKLLSCEEMTQEQIIEHIFKSKKSDYELRTDSLYKYLNTFKLFGLNVVKNNGKFVLEKAPLGISFSEKELNTMNFLYSFVREKGCCNK